MKFKILFFVIIFFQILNSQTKKIDFKWEKDSLNGRLIDKIAMSVPFKIENKEYRFQFDLGANMTLIYDKCFDKSEFIKKKIIDKTSDANGLKVFYIEDQTVQIGNFIKPHYKLFGLLDFDQGEVCGVVGSDIFKEKILIIDFPNNQIIVKNKLSKSELKGVNFVDIQIINNKPIIPINIDGKIYHFQYDSGASIFPMYTYKQNFSELISKSRAKDSLNIKNFNNPLIVKSISTDKVISIGNDKYNLNELWYSDDDLFSLKNSKIDGIIGNVFFLNKKIIIDFKNKKFAVLKK